MSLIPRRRLSKSFSHACGDAAVIGGKDVRKESWTFPGRRQSSVSSMISSPAGPVTIGELS